MLPGSTYWQEDFQQMCRARCFCHNFSKCIFSLKTQKQPDCAASEPKDAVRSGIEVAGLPSPDGALSGGPKPRSRGSHTQECLERLPDEGLAGALGLHLALDVQGPWRLQSLQLSRGDLGMQVEGRGLGAAGPWLLFPCCGPLCLHCRVTREGLCDRGARICSLAGSH